MTTKTYKTVRAEADYLRSALAELAAQTARLAGSGDGQVSAESIRLYAEKAVANAAPVAESRAQTEPRPASVTLEARKQRLYRALFT